MLQIRNNEIHESNTVAIMTQSNVASNIGGSLTTSCYDTSAVWTTHPYTFWSHYPVYVCLDKTKKAVDILKALQADKQIECKSVSKFIELVEKIAGLL